MQSGQNVRTMTGYALALLDLCWSPDGRFVVSDSSEATLTLWEVTTRTPVQVLRAPAAGGCRGLEPGHQPHRQREY